jgi:translation initiation factor 2 subunit 2
MSRLIIRGKYVQKHIESIFKKYMIEYVHCESCNKYNTSLLKDQITRLYFIKCNMCNSTKTVDHIKMCKY